jgi:integration host factor subunit alpha
VTKADIARRIQDKIGGVNPKESMEMLEGVLELMKGTLESGEPIKIHGFGNFLVKTKKARRGRNPQTGESITLPSRRVLVFKASPILRNAVNGGK